MDSPEGGCVQLEVETICRRGTWVRWGTRGLDKEMTLAMVQAREVTMSLGSRLKLTRAKGILAWLDLVETTFEKDSQERC